MGKKLLEEASKEPGSLIGKAATGVLFDIPRIGPWLQKKIVEGILKAEELKAFENQVRKEYEGIPEGKTISPNPRLVIQALTAAEPILIEGEVAEDLRTMFAKLIAASCDSDKADYVHPSFSSVLGEMSPIDAQILLLFKQNKSLPIADYRYQLADGFIDFETTVFLDAPEGISTEIAAISLQCLAHLGLLNIDYSSSFTLTSRYEKYENYPSYCELKQTIHSPDYQRILKDFPKVITYPPTERARIWDLLKNEDEFVKSSDDRIRDKIFLGVSDIILKKGIVSLTKFGLSFLRCCS